MLSLFISSSGFGLMQDGKNPEGFPLGFQLRNEEEPLGELEECIQSYETGWTGHSVYERDESGFAC